MLGSMLVCCSSFVLPRNSLLRRQTDRIKRGQRPVNRGFFLLRREGSRNEEESSLAPRPLSPLPPLAAAAAAGLRGRERPRRRSLLLFLSLASFSSPRGLRRRRRLRCLMGQRRRPRPQLGKGRRLGRESANFEGETNMADAPTNLK